MKFHFNFFIREQGMSPINMFLSKKTHLSHILILHLSHILILLFILRIFGPGLEKIQAHLFPTLFTSLSQS